MFDNRSYDNFLLFVQIKQSSSPPLWIFKKKIYGSGPIRFGDCDRKKFECAGVEVVVQQMNGNYSVTSFGSGNRIYLLTLSVSFLHITG